MKPYDLVVIGSGPAGFAAAMRAIDYKKNVCMIECNNLGGAGIMNGALTSKTMWELSKDYSIAASVNRGYRASGLMLDFNQVKKSVIQAARHKQFQLLSQIETFSPEKRTNGNITLIEGRARFLDRQSVEVTHNNETQIIRGENFIIATGSRPRPLPGIEIDHQRIITSEDILKLKQFPERMVIIGSGIVGCEFAAIFSNFNQTEVHLLDRARRVIPFEDDDVSDFVSKNLAENGVIIHHTAHLRDIRKYDTHLEIVLDYDAGHSRVLEVDVALISIGRIPNVNNLGLENVGIEPNQRGFLDINEKCRITTVAANKKSNIFAAGDITGNAQLYSVAEFEGRNAAKAIYNRQVLPADYSTMSTLMFFKPAVAAVGVNEKMLQRRNIAYRSVTYSMQLVNRAIAMRNTTGFVKIIVSNDGENRILGMRAGGSHASSFIISVAHLIKGGNSLQDVMKIIYPHPSMTEAIQDCLRVLKGESIYKPEAFPDLIQLRSWPEEK